MVSWFSDASVEDHADERCDADESSDDPDGGGPCAAGSDEFPVGCVFADGKFLGGALGFVENVAVVADGKPCCSDDEHGSYDHHRNSVFVGVCSVHVWVEYHEAEEYE